MKALVKDKPGVGNVSLRDVPVPECLSDQVLLKVHCCGICGTDLHVFHDTFKNYPPVILGHEFSGTVIETGSTVKDIQIGEHFAVLGATAVTCGTCAYCKNGSFMFCKSRRGMGHGVNGAFTDYVVVRPDQLFSLTDEISLKIGALVEPLAVAVHAVCEIARFKLGDTVLVSGPGPIGLLCLKLLKTHGIKTIVAGTSRDNFRLSKALHYGADAIIKADTEDFMERVQDFTNGQGVDLVMECAGVEASARNCLLALKPMGNYVQVGHFGHDLKLPWDVVAFKQLTVAGTVGYTRDTWFRALQILKQGKLEIEDIITHEFSLQDWQKGFDLSEQKTAIKVLLYPG